jgi:hypothetical protein
MMMVMTDDKRMECETTIRWDLLDPMATLFTGDPVVKREWESLSYKVTQPVKGVKAWIVRVPIDRINFKPLKRGVAKVEAVKVA